mmetsp:Transcript_20893/g.67287  ORF Transcript_20893/g.67287 Transcript_20893/m.67287 type:complete len:220 (+) Transcript_20893:387-1046(+)
MDVDDVVEEVPSPDGAGRLIEDVEAEAVAGVESGEGEPGAILCEGVVEEDSEAGDGHQLVLERSRRVLDDGEGRELGSDDALLFFQGADPVQGGVDVLRRGDRGDEDQAVGPEPLPSELATLQRVLSRCRRRVEPASEGDVLEDGLQAPDDDGEFVQERRDASLGDVRLRVARKISVDDARLQRPAVTGPPIPEDVPREGLAVGLRHQDAPALSSSLID